MGGEGVEVEVVAVAVLVAMLRCAAEGHLPRYLAYPHVTGISGFDQSHCRNTKAAVQQRHCTTPFSAMDTFSHNGLEELYKRSLQLGHLLSFRPFNSSAQSVYQPRKLGRKTSRLKMFGR